MSDSEEIDSQSIGDMYEMGQVTEFKSPGPRGNQMRTGAKGGLTQELLNKEREIMEERYKYEKNYVHLEMAHQKTHFLKRAGELDREVTRLRTEKTSLEHVLEAQKREFDLEMLQREKVTKEELVELKEAHRQLEEEAPGLKKKLDHYRVELRQPLVSEETYLEYRGKAEKKRNLKEFV